MIADVFKVFIEDQSDPTRSKKQKGNNNRNDLKPDLVIMNKNITECNQAQRT